MSRYSIEDAVLVDIANAIRNRTGSTDLIDPVDMADAIETIEAGLDTSDATATANDILSGKTAYVDSEKITGTIVTRTSSNLTASGATVTVPAGYYASQATKSVSTATQATPSVSIDANGKISASATQTAGYVSAGTKTGTKQMTTQAAKTITPSTSIQTAVAKNVYTTGAVTVAAIPSNYEDVGAETTEYTSLNAELEAVINSLPEAGGGSGGGIAIETCTVRIEFDSSVCFGAYAAQICENGTISTHVKYGSGAYSPSPIIINNVIVGTAIIIETVSSIQNYFVQATNAQVIATTYYTIYVVSNAANDTAIIGLTSGGGGGN